MIEILDIICKKPNFKNLLTRLKSFWENKKPGPMKINPKIKIGITDNKNEKGSTLLTDSYTDET
ncbi:MAG: hypothetical protein QXF25_00515 [Candidatus Pacearchaeota archaeon]